MFSNQKNIKVFNIVIFHNFDYPEGMASTKRFQLFANYFLRRGCTVTIVLKTNVVNPLNFEKGEHNGINYCRVFCSKNRKYPFYYDKKQNHQLLNIIDNLYNNNSRNIILSEGVTPESQLVLRKLIPKWQLFCDYVEDYTKIGTINSGYCKRDIWRFFKSKLASICFTPCFLIAENFMFKKAIGISAISPYLFEKAKKRNKYVVNIPVTANEMSFIQKIDSKKPKVLFFAGSGTLKDGLDTIAKAFDLIVNNFDVYLKISGKIGKDGIEMIKQNCRNINKVYFLGYLDEEDYFKELQQADILLMTRNGSKYSNAGFPFKIGEYLASGNPVIATKVSGIDFYLKNKVNALLIEPENTISLAEGMKYLLEHTDEAYRIGINGRDVYNKYFSAEKNNKIFYDFILKSN